MSFSSRKNSNRIKQGVLWLAAIVAFVSIIVASAIAASPPSPPVVVTPTVVPVTPTVPVTPPPPPKEQPLQADRGYYGVLSLEGSGMGTTPVFFVPATFKVIWRCTPIGAPHWLRMPIYQLQGKGVAEQPDVMNGTCTPGQRNWGYGHATYPPGTYSITALSHVAQKWELLIETKTLDVKVS